MLHQKIAELATEERIRLKWLDLTWLGLAWLTYLLEVEKKEGLKWSIFKSQFLKANFYCWLEKFPISSTETFWKSLICDVFHWGFCQDPNQSYCHWTLQLIWAFKSHEITWNNKSIISNCINSKCLSWQLFFLMMTIVFLVNCNCFSD